MALLANIHAFFFFLFLFKYGVNASLDSLSVCQNGTFDSTQQYKLSTAAVLSDLAAHSLTNTFYHSSSSASGLSKTTYGLFYCTANVSPKACQACVQKAVADAQLYCSSYKAAVVFYTDCTLRYNNTAVYATPDASIVGWNFTTGFLSSVSYTGFNKTLYDTMNTLITRAAYGSGSKGFATGDAGLVGTTKRLYALAQCTPDILGGSCKTCLDEALVVMPGCCINDIWGTERTLLMTFLPSCQLRYEVKYPSTSSGSSTSYTPGKMVSYIIGTLLVIVFGLL